MLIKCPECNHDVSDKAQFCPQCGYPINEIKANLANQECPICKSKEHILLSGKDVCKECGYIFREDMNFKSKEKKELVLSSEECPICKSNRHFLKDDNDVCEECGYIFKRNLSIPEERVESKRNKISCKYCGSTNVKKLGYWEGGWKSTYGGLQWHCNNCDSDF